MYSEDANRFLGNLDSIQQMMDQKQQKRLETKRLKRIIELLFEQSYTCEVCRQYYDTIEEQLLDPLRIQNTDSLKGYEQHKKAILSHMHGHHKMVADGTYTGAFMSIGVAIGISLGMMFDNAALGIPIGIAMGLALGAGLDADARKKGKVI